MAEIINLRRRRKGKAHAAKAAEANANRAKHGIAKPARALAKARREKNMHDVDAHRLDEKR